MADLSQTARNPNGDFLRGTPTNLSAGSLFFEAPVFNQPRRFVLTTGGMTEQRNLGGGGGGASGGGDSSSGLPSGPIAPTTPEEFAAQSARNQQLNDFLTGLTKMSPTGLLMSSLNTLFGSQAPAPVENAGGYGGYIGTPSYESGIGIPGESLANEARDQFDANQGAAVGGDVGSISDQNTAGDGGGYGGYSDSAGSDSFGGGEYNMGGLVDRVGGPNPPGPDDGAGMLQLGEYVIKKSAVDKYGTGLLDMINMGKISTGAIPAGNPVLAKTWDAAAAQKAKMLEDMGADPKTIWQQTGTWKGLDGKWRQEVMQ